MPAICSRKENLGKMVLGDEHEVAYGSSLTTAEESVMISGMSAVIKAYEFYLF